MVPKDGPAGKPWRASLASALRDHLGVDAGAVETAVFPESRSAPPLDVLFAA